VDRLTLDEFLVNTQTQYQAEMADEIAEEIRDEAIVERDEDSLTGAMDTLLSISMPIARFDLIPVQQWDDIQVTTTSLFGDNRWDWSGMGNYPTGSSCTWDDSACPGGCGILHPERGLLLRLVKAIVYGMLPHTRAFTYSRSYNSVAKRVYAAKYLARLLAQHHLYDGPADAATFATINDISPTTIRDSLLRDIPTPHQRRDVAQLLTIWHALSQAGRLPGRLSCVHAVVDSSLQVRLEADVRASHQPFLPMSVEAFEQLVRAAKEFLYTHADDIVWAYKTLLPTFAQPATEVWDRERQRNVYVREGFDWDQTIETFQAHPSLLWDDVINGLTTQLDWSSRSTSRAGLHMRLRQIVRTLVSLVRGAATILILAATGMRGSEVATLEKGCATPNGDNQYRIRVTIWKTAPTSAGDTKWLPIPKIAFDAIQKLESLTDVVRVYTPTNNLFVTIGAGSRPLGYPIHKEIIGYVVQQFATFAGVDERVHPHQFRKFLAMFIIYQDPRHLGLITHLFSHRSYKMTLLYLLDSPGIAAEVRAYMIEHNRALLVEIINACESGKIAGRAGKAIQGYLSTTRLFPGVLRQDAGTLEEFIDCLIQSSMTVLHRTPMSVICTKVPGMAQKSPCDPPAGPGYVRLLPNIRDCDAIDCPFAVYTEASIPKLVRDIAFYTGLLERPAISATMQAHAHQRIAKSQDKLCELGYDDPAVGRV